MKLKGARDGNEVSLPQDLDAIVIETSKGGIYIDLSGPVPDMVLMRATYTGESRNGDVRLILSPMNGRMAVGVIRT